MEQPVRIKKIPERQCLGCNARRPKRELIRVVRAPDGTVSLDFNGRASGRGAYICPDVRCFSRARKSRRIEHNLDCKISDELYDELEREIQCHAQCATQCETQRTAQTKPQAGDAK